MKTPKPEPYLNKEAKVIYRRIGELLEEYEAIEAVDSYGLSMAAFYLELFQRHAEEDPVQTFKNGTQQVSPSFSIMKDAREGFIKLSAKYGLSNKDRELMMKFKVKKEEQDDLDKI